MALRAKDVGGEFLTSREYQVDIYEHAIKQDSILLMPTGSGKTYISILLMKHMASQLGSDKKTAVFIVDRNVLLEQQWEQIRTNTPLKVGKWTTGQDGCNMEKNFRQFVVENDVIVVNAQIVVDALSHKIIDETMFALIVIDECHHCLGSQHPYRQLTTRLKKFKRESNSDCFRIIGLTSCALNRTVTAETIAERITLLENILGAKIISSDAVIQSSKYSNRPKELVVYFSPDSGEYDFTVLNKLEVFLHSLGDFDNATDSRGFILDCIRRVKGVMEDCGIYCAYKSAVQCAKKLKSMDDINSEDNMIILRIATTAFESFCFPLHSKLSRCHKFEAIFPYLSRQVILILESLEKFHDILTAKQLSLTAIVFLERKCSVVALCNLLRYLAQKGPRFNFIKADCTVGTGSQGIDAADGTETIRFKSKNLTDAIANFRTGQTNVMISTRVLEEGIDIRSCNLIIKGNIPSTYSSYVQSRGRARMSPSLYIMLCPFTEMTAGQSKISAYRRIEKLLTDRLPSWKNIAPERTTMTMDITPDDVLPPYVVPSTGAKVTMTSAISLINRYCARLPSDVFTRLTAQAKCIRQGFLFVSYLRFPINSPIKETIVGKPCTTMRLADMAVALIACQVLHERGELDDNLLPLTKDKVANLLELADEFEEYAANVPRKTGSSKKRRVYARCIAKALSEALPNPGQEFHIYLIEMDLVEPISEQSNPKKRKIINPKNTPYIFGLCTTKKFPPIPPFPVYQRQGKVIAKFKLYKEKMVLNADELELIKEFHAYIFAEILGMRTEMEFIPEKAPFSTLLIPLKNNGNEKYLIDFNVARETLKGFPPKPTDEERKSFVYDPELYRDAVIKPWYRPNERDAYYIGEVETNIYPNSNFADQKYKTFAEYFKEKYDLEVYHHENPLLDVDNTSNRMNLLLPRITATKAFKRSLDHNQKQFMVPELVSIHPMPASFWIMVIELPTVLFRLNCLLLTDEFRARVSVPLEMTAGVPDEFEWDELSYPIPQNTNYTGVRTLEQLKRVNAFMAVDAVDEGKDDVDDKSLSENEQPDFTIGVWDPALGDKYRDMPLNLPGEEPTSEQIVVDDDDYFLDDDKEWSKIAIDMSDFSRAKETLIDQDENFENCPVLGWDDENVQSIQTVDGELAITSVIGLDSAELTRDIARIIPGEPLSKKRKIEERNNFEANTGEDEIDGTDLNDPGLLVDEELDENESPTLKLGFADEQPTMEVKTTDSSFDVFDDDADDLPLDVISDVPKTLSERIHVPELPDYMKPWFIWDKMKWQPYGVPPTLLIQALTTSSASDGFSLERLETIGDSFLKLSVTNYFYNKYPEQHEGRLSLLRSKEVSNEKLFRLGKMIQLPSIMECSKFDPTVNWLPPGFVVQSPGFDESIVDVDEDDIKASDGANGWVVDSETDGIKTINEMETLVLVEPKADSDLAPYSINHLYQQNISDKAIADSIEALIGAHLVTLGPKRTLKFMNWLKIHVLIERPNLKSPVELYLPRNREDQLPKYQAKIQKLYHDQRFHLLEKNIGYEFNDRSYLIQAFTHGSYISSRVTSCYQRLEFLGDAVLDYLITRYLFESKMQYSPGVLTDLRSALVNNVIFASLAVKHGMHKYLLLHSAALHQMINRFVKLHCQTGEINFNDEMVTEEEVLEGGEEDVEVPKALGDVFESLAGAIYLDCGMDLEIVCRVFFNIMQESIEKCCQNPPQSPIRELFEMKHHKVRFSKVERALEKTAARVTVDIDHGKFQFAGVGRSYRIAKTTAAKAALRYLRELDAGRLAAQ